MCLCGYFTFMVYCFFCCFLVFFFSLSKITREKKMYHQHCKNSSQQRVTQNIWMDKIDISTGMGTMFRMLRA